MTMKPSHTLLGQARTSLLWRPYFLGFRGPRRPRIVGPIVRFARYSSMRRRSKPKARCLDDVSSTPAGACPRSDLTRTHQSTRHRKAAGYAPWSWCMSVLAATMTRTTPSTPIGVPMAMRGRELAVASPSLVSLQARLRASRVSRSSRRLPRCSCTETAVRGLAPCGA